MPSNLMDRTLGNSLAQQVQLNKLKILAKAVAQNLKV